MSMISAQIDELRAAAQACRSLGRHEMEQTLLDAADLIWELRDNLQCANEENARLRETLQRRSEQLNGTGEMWVDRGVENAKLRELVKDMWHLMDGSGVTTGAWGRCVQILDRMRELGGEVDE